MTLVWLLLVIGHWERVLRAVPWLVPYPLLAAQRELRSLLCHVPAAMGPSQSQSNVVHQCPSLSSKTKNQDEPLIHK